jgi:membrane associated rhomboid family serine protease
MDNPVRLMAIGLIGLIIGVVLPFMMVLRLIEPSFLLSFFSYGASIVGLLLGLLGAVSYARNEHEKRRDPWE